MVLIAIEVAHQLIAVMFANLMALALKTTWPNLKLIVPNQADL